MVYIGNTYSQVSILFCLQMLYIVYICHSLLTVMFTDVVYCWHLILIVYCYVYRCSLLLILILTLECLLLILQMAFDLSSFLREPQHQAWLKAVLSLHITRAGLVELVDKELTNFHTDLLTNTIQQHNLQSDFKCNTCKSPHTLCRICKTLERGIVLQHRYGRPSWGNTNVLSWYSIAWENGKCYLPLYGYKDKASVHDVDFNGIINLFINCKRFDNYFIKNVKQTVDLCKDVSKAVCVQ